MVPSHGDAPDAPTDEGLIGRVIASRYHLLRVVAEGGMAVVYVAKDLERGHEVAVKIMHADLTRERGFAARFKREAAIAGKLAHPGILSVTDHGTDGHLFYLVMELLDGADIFEVLRVRRRLDEGIARRVVVDVCEALAAAHAGGIVHRDLKPENVFLRRTPGRDRLSVVVLDFGVAKMVLPEERPSDEAETALTAVGTLLGTPEYLSPEMCLGEDVGPPADLYACGVLLYALVVGRPPFVTDRPIDVTFKHISEAPVAPSVAAGASVKLDPRLDAVVLKALAKSPADRHASASALADALRALGPLSDLPDTLIRGIGAVPKNAAAPSIPSAAPTPTVTSAPTLAVPDGLPKIYPSQFPPPDESTQLLSGEPPHEPSRTQVWEPPVASPSVPREVGPPTRTSASEAPDVSRASDAIARPSASAPSAADRTRSPTFVALAAVILAVTFAAGVATGRATAPRADPRVMAP